VACGFLEPTGRQLDLHTPSEDQPMTATSSPSTTADFATVAELARQLRVDSIRASTSAGSGHPTSSMSAADLLAVLVARHLRYDWEHPKAAANDHLIFSKGHASPLLYSVDKASSAWLT
jgi:transketolase